MTPRYLLDTNILSNPARPKPDERVLARLEQHSDRLATASIVWHELYFGLQRLPPSRRRRIIEGYLRDTVTRVAILPYDSAAAQWHAAERARLVSAGLTPPYADGQIAAIARVNGLVLVTDNEADFCHFRDLEVENWLRA